MANLTRYEPFGDLDDLFKGFMLRPVRLDQQAPQIKMDVNENNSNYVVHAEIPGVKKEDIKVELDGNVVSISSCNDGFPHRLFIPVFARARGKRRSLAMRCRKGSASETMSNPGSSIRPRPSSEMAALNSRARSGGSANW